jgi:hypothetical protein
MLDWIFSFALTCGAFGLWIILLSITGLLDGLPRLIEKMRQSELDKIGEVRPGKGAPENLDWPLFARLAKSFARVARNAPEGKDLMIRLLQAGLPYHSPAHYYGRQVTSALLFAAFGLVNAAAMALVFHLPAAPVIAVAFALGLWGSTQPAAEVRAKIARRRRDLTLDMIYQLPRLVLLLGAYGSIQDTIAAYRATAQDESEDLAKRQEYLAQAQRYSEEFGIVLGESLAGLGGNLFAELLNRFAGELSRNVQPPTAAERLLLVYPPSIELRHFLDILVAGIQGGLPMKERLAELSNELRVDLRARQREAAQAANQVVILAAAAELLPIFAVVGAPVLYVAFRMFQ